MWVPASGRRPCASHSVRPQGARGLVSRAAPGVQELELHFGDTTVSFPVRADQAQQLAAAVSGVMKTFAEKQQAERPKRWDSMEFKMKGAMA